MPAKIFIGLGIVLLAIGVILQFAPGLLGWFGRLPGDINISRDGTRIFIPITSMIVISVVVTIILNVFFRR